MSKPYVRLFGQMVARWIFMPEVPCLLPTVDTFFFTEFFYPAYRSVLKAVAALVAL